MVCICFFFFFFNFLFVLNHILFEGERWNGYLKRLYQKNNYFLKDFGHVMIKIKNLLRLRYMLSGGCWGYGYFLKLGKKCLDLMNDPKSHELVDIFFKYNVDTKIVINNKCEIDDDSLHEII